MNFFHISYSSFKTNILTNSEKIIEIPKWTTFYWLSEVLENNWIKLNDFYFKIYIKLWNINFPLQAWNFKIPAWANIETLLDSLQNPYVNTDSITILEWWNIYDIDNMLTNKWLITKWDFIDIASNYKTTDYDFLTNWKSLEGFLYPDTYEISLDNFSSTKLIKKMLDNFELKIWDSLKIYLNKKYIIS